MKFIARNMLKKGDVNFVLAYLVLFLGCMGSIQANEIAGERWVGTWACAPYAAAEHTPPSPYLANNTLRQVVRISIGGDTLRLKLSNITSSNPVELKAVNIALSTDGTKSAIDASTLTPLTFGGEESVTMNAYTELSSDPVAFSLSPNDRLAITIHYGACETAPDMTFHYGSRTDSYILTGDHATSEGFAGATRVERWYHLSNIDVLASSESASVAVLGNSITDGYGLHGGLKNKWTDAFSEKLLENEATNHVGVLNLGIGATLLTTSGVSRFRHDVLEQSGLRWILVFYGVNDIGGGVSADQIIGAYEALIEMAHLHNVRIYGATITPFKGSGYYSEYNEAARNQVNEWIRTAGKFDQYIDFDKAIRDSSDTEKLQDIYSNDWLHPNADGYRFLGESVDPTLFLGEDTIYSEQSDTSNIQEIYFEAECEAGGENWLIEEDAGSSNGAHITVRNGVQSLDGPAPESDQVNFSFTIDNDSVHYLYARINCPSPDDDSFWIKMDNNDWIMCNGLGTSGWQWVELQRFDLEAGEHTLSLSYREDGARLDKVCISNYGLSPYGMGGEASNSCEINTDPNAINETNAFKLLQNRPNPFTNSTAIRFKTNKREVVKLMVFDISGKKVATLIDQKLPAGQHQINWDGVNERGELLNGGNYFYRLQVGTQITTRKMLLVR